MRGTSGRWTRFPMALLHTNRAITRMRPCFICMRLISMLHLAAGGNPKCPSELCHLFAWSNPSVTLVGLRTPLLLSGLNLSSLCIISRAKARAIEVCHMAETSKLYFSLILCAYPTDLGLLRLLRLEHMFKCTNLDLLRCFLATSYWEVVSQPLLSSRCKTIRAPILRKPYFFSESYVCTIPSESVLCCHAGKPSCLTI